ncbi:WD40 repeat domain-containing protein, partial [Nostoc sp. LEGE 12450]|uniref:WD40 repeat domain-containing protein n=1 Tax=Nostoc sp. LEGE 12450 TaxID=1828643 RepID=UPI001A04BF7C|nr:hypothetical protein [Nostoc sp. LEGE 12450]
SFVNSVAFSPDGKTIASGSSDNTVRLWNLAGQELKTLKGHSSYVLSVAFSPDGKTIASGSNDNTVRLWNLDLENLLTLGCEWLQDYLRFHPESLEELEPCQTPNLLLAAADSLVTQGEKLAQAGDFERAVEKFKKANSWKPKLVLNPEIKAAPAYVAQGEEKAKDGDIPGAVAKFKQAQQLDSKIDLEPDTHGLQNNPETLVKKLALVQQGQELAKNGNIPGAVAKFKQAQQLDSKIDLEPDTHGLQNNPETIAKKLVVEALVAQSKELLKQGDVKQAIKKYTEIEKLQPTPEIPADSWNSLCWLGSLHNHAADVMFACEKAVILAPKDTSIQDSRGLARALTGNIKGAVEDFEAYIKSTDNDPNGYKAQRRRWVNALNAGKNPFTPEELKKLPSD